jgi:23S rRNA pseudouridine1911/1915/1917 synthase
MTKQFRERDVEKVYWAIVEGVVEPANGHLIDFMRKDERHRRMHVTGPNTPEAQRAELSFRLVRRLAGASLLEVRPVTGRKHQIRVQLSHAGIPIVGDRKYGSTRPFPGGIALHSRRLVIAHPVSKMQLAIEAPLPAAWDVSLAGGS